jgi:hypothetical protein
MKAMKGTSDSTTWVPIVAGVLGLLAAGIAVRHCGSSRSPESVTGPQLASKARRPDNERGGWIAQSGTENLGTERARSGTAGGMASRGSGGSRGGSEPDDVASAHGGSGAVERDFRDTDTMDTGGEAINGPPRVPPAGIPAGGVGAPGGSSGAASGPPSAPGQEQGGKPSSDKAAAPQTQDVAPAKDAAKAGAPNDNGPVLSLPLDKSTDPEQGNTSPIIANGVTFDENGAHFAADAQLFIPSEGNINSAAGTLTFWMLPDWAGDVESQSWILHLGPLNTWANRLDIFKDYAYLRLLICPDSGIESGVGPDIRGWKKGDRHLITATWGDGVVALYIDGASVGARDYDGELDFGPNPPLFLGSGNPQVKAGANSNIRNFQIYTRALNPDEVAALYAQPPS